MKKLGCGHAIGHVKAWDALGMPDWYNWMHMASLQIPEAYVWPMIHPGGYNHVLAKDYLSRMDYNHVLWYNEPLLTDGEGLARWINEQHKSLGVWDGAVNICGNFLVQAGHLEYSTIRQQMRRFVAALDVPEAGMGIHLYHDEMPGSTDAAVRWFDNTLAEVCADFPKERIAVTEWGVLKSLYRAGRGPDVPRYQEYMWRTWELMRNYGIYAAAWFVAINGGDQWRNADITLCDANGDLRPLGETYRDLLTEGPVQPEPSEPGNGDDKWQHVHTATWALDGYDYRSMIERRAR